MAWPSKIYVATSAGGVYYTSNFVDPSTQPTWTAINTGLAALDCVEFHLDPFDNFDRQYVATATTSSLYKREGQGSWVAILNLAGIQALYPGVTAASITGFYPDPSIVGRIWAAIFTVWSPEYDTRLYVIYSNDYGETWNTVTPVQYGVGFTSVNIKSVRAWGSDIYVGVGFRYNNVTGERIFNSDDGGATWHDGYINEFYPAAIINPLAPTFAYTIHKPSDTTYISKIAPGADDSFTDLASVLNLGRFDSMWFDPGDALHQRALYQYKNFVTDDDWATSSENGIITGSPISFAPWAGADTDQMLVGLTINHGTQDHAIGALFGEDDIVAAGIAGASPEVAPFTDSIPYTAGNVCRCGIQAAQASIPHVYTHAIAMPDYDGEERGIPIQGDRSARDAANYPERHTNDIDIAGGIHHTLGDGEYQAAPGDHVHAASELYPNDPPNKPPWNIVIADDTLNDQGVHHWTQQAILVGNGKTFIFYMADDYDTYCIVYDHELKSFASPVWVADGHAADNHNYYSAIMDDDGYIHIFGGCHASDLYYKRSSNPYDISAWSAEVSLATYGTYPKAIKDSTGNMYIFYRQSTDAVGGQYLQFRKSSNKGAVWSSAVTIINSADHDDWVYAGNIGIGNDDSIHLIWTWRDSGGSNNPSEFRDLCYARSLDGGVTWEKSDGTDYVLPISQAAAEVIYSGQYCLPEQVVLDEANNPHAIYLYCNRTPTAYWTDNELHYCYLSGGVWQDDTLPEDHYEAASIIIDGTMFYVLSSRLIDSYREMVLLYSMDEGANWEEFQITSESTAHNDEAEFKYFTDGGLEFVYTQAQDLHYMTEDWVEQMRVDTIEDLPGTDEMVKVSANDTTAGYLNGKLVAGNNITLTELSDGGNETLRVAVTNSQYLQFLYEVSGGTFTFLTDVDGNPLMGLQDLE